jgi:hypothetical protein
LNEAFFVFEKQDKPSQVNKLIVLKQRLKSKDSLFSFGRLRERE